MIQQGEANNGHWKFADMIVTASLSTGIASVAHDVTEATALVEKIMRTDHVEWETTLSVGDVEFRSTKEGPFPNHQLRISVRPYADLAAINYIDHDDPTLSSANSYNPKRPLPDVRLIFNGATSQLFPRTAAIPIKDAHAALMEWLHTRRRPRCIEWRPFGTY